MPKTKRKTRRQPRPTLARRWHRYNYKQTTIAILIILVFAALLDTFIIQNLWSYIQGLGLIGVFIAGIMFVSFFTAAPSVVMLVAFAGIYNPIVVALVAGVGTIIGDWLILKILEDEISRELKPLAKKWGLMPVVRVFSRKMFRPLAVVVGAILIASPLPDELALAVLGASRLSTTRILMLAFVLNTAGILALVLAAQALVTS